MSRPSDALRALLAACAFAAAGPVFALANEPPDADLRMDVLPADRDSLEVLRADAAFDGDARSQLARRLLDRFEAAGDKADLREAVRWIARDEDQQVFLRRECQRPVLRWYWVCGSGE